MNDRATPAVSLIIPVYNDPERLKTCLQALEEQTYLQNAYRAVITSIVNRLERNLIRIEI